MTDREKLIELLRETEINKINGHTVEACVSFTPKVFENFADHLLANGVTFATDTNVGSTWEPISDPPPTGEVLAYSKESGYMAVGWIEPCLNRNGEIEFICENGLEPLVGVTHWMPPPEPPKED